MLWLSITRTAAADQIAWSPEDWAVLACWAGRYTPRVVLRPDALGLELAGSLRLFGGLTALMAVVREDLARINRAEYVFHTAVAATFRAALWLSHAGQDCVCEDGAATRLALRQLPLPALPLAEAVKFRLTGFGFCRLGEVMDLPRSALGPRLGKQFVLDLARTLGEMEDPQPWFVFPEQFSQRLELPAPVEASPVLLFAARRLIAALAGWLDARNVAVRQINLLIDHGRGVETPLLLRFSAPVYALARIERVLRECLSRCVLPSPALALALIADDTEARSAGSQFLFEGGAGSIAEESALADFLDRVNARLGAHSAHSGTDAVRQWTCHADFRPEQATQAYRGRGRSARVDAGDDVASGQAVMGSMPARLTGARPVWLLDEPRRLIERNGHPCDVHQRKPLQLVAGPERIEAGWWDGGEARRDYFIALDAARYWCWIFRRQDIDAGWFIHGWFS